MVGKSTYLGYLGTPEKICSISSQAKISSTWTFFPVKVVYFGLWPREKKSGGSCRKWRHPGRRKRLFKDIYTKSTNQTGESVAYFHGIIVRVRLKVDRRLIHNDL